LTVDCFAPAVAGFFWVVAVAFFGGIMVVAARISRVIGNENGSRVVGSRVVRCSCSCNSCRMVGKPHLIWETLYILAGYAGL